ncbi:unnamed protein product [Brachionus calyciflorus]|uniref:Uncharacterized protein n=1 Tax=Brachionus calyciflorus TaxID=104777 RepID=A0A813VN41_9BILA|nr:unnamed protein product [Brachionus calyciflorus]
MVAEYKNVFAAVVSSTCVTVLASLPKIITEPKHVIISSMIAGGVGIAKYKFNWTSLGFHKNEIVEKKDKN